MSGEWFDDEEFWRIFGDCMFRPDRFEAAAEEVDPVLALTGVETRRVLDLGCGPGRHAVPLAARGLQVTAVDLSRHLLDRGEERASVEDAQVEWVQEDMRRFQREGAFDLIRQMSPPHGPTPEQLIADMPNIGGQLFRGVQYRVHQVGNGYGRLQLTESGTPSLAGCVTALGFLDRSLERFGGVDVEVNLASCRALGDEACMFDISWLT